MKYSERVCIYTYIYIYILFACLGPVANLCQVQNGQNDRPLRSHCVQLKYSLQILKYILITPASAIYALFVVNTKETRNQYCVSHYGSTFEVVLHLRCNRPTSEFRQYL